ncbi:MAG: IS5 family transposase [Acidobacteria bacterium]|nr:IS5 family transposase [Acidobacteriota bacterium]
MRGHVDPQGGLFSYFSVEERIPADHPLRRVKAQADAVLAGMGAALERMYADCGRPSIAPERLLKATLLIALYSVRSDRLFCEMLDYNMLFRWFLDLGLEERSFDHSSFSKNRSRLIEHEIARAFFAGAVEQARAQRLLSDEHFTVDGTLIEAWASLKSLEKKDGTPPRSGGDGTGMVDFRGEKRTNATHASSTDPEAKLMRRGNGQPAKLSFGAQAVMENRHGLLIDLAITDATLAEPKAADPMLDRRRRARGAMKTLGADKGYHTKEFVARLRKKRIAPHIARIERRSTPGLDGRTSRHEGYRISQRKRKRIEEIFGWMKAVGGLRKSRFIGIAKTQLAAYMVGAAYNLLRMAKLAPSTA